MDSHFLNSLNHKDNLPYTPTWLMRQAGRYLPEYMQIRNKAGSFMQLCTNPELACQVSLQPLKRFHLDAAILFSDILVVPDAMGLGLYFAEGEGPKFHKPVTSIFDIDNLSTDGILDKLSYVFTTIKNLKTELPQNTPLIGFSGSPFTLACYMLEGGSSTSYAKVKQWLVNNPEYSHKLLSKITDAVTIYLNEQIRCGVDTVMIFDSWGGILTEPLYLEFSLTYIKQVLSKLNLSPMQTQVPSIVFTKGGGLWMQHLAQISSTALGIDWTIDIGRAKKMCGNKALQGNLDPVILAVGDKSAIKKEVEQIIHSYVAANDGKLSGHIFNLGHGILPITNPDNVAYLVDTVREVSSKFV